MVHPSAEDPDPTVPRRSRRLLRWVLLGLVGVVVLGLVVAGLVYSRLQGNITATDIRRSLGNHRPGSPSPVDPQTHRPAMNILVIGSDDRSQLANPKEFGGHDVPGARSDTTLLVHLAANRRTATVVSIPRDSMVPMPSCTDPDAGLSGAPVRQFNAAFALGGPGCTVRTVEANTGIRIDHFAVLNFDGFQAMVDALGGVDVTLPQAVRDPKSRLDLPAGTSHVDGDQALAYVRQRYSLGDGSDLGRIKRQQAFLSSLAHQARSTQVLVRPDRLLGFLDAATKSLTTDPEWASIGSLAVTALQVRGMAPGSARFVTVPVRAYPADPNRVEWRPDAASLWQALRTDRPLPDAAATVQAAPGATG